MAIYRGVSTAQRFADDVAAEYEALRGGCGLVDQTFVGGLSMTGADRQRYLNGLVTCDTKSLEAGQAVYGFVTSVKGRVLADLTVLATDDALWLELPPGDVDGLVEHLGKYIIVDRVEIGALPWRPVVCVGPQAESALTALGVSAAGLEVHRHQESQLFGQTVRVQRLADLRGVPRWSLWLPSESAADLYSQLIQRGREDGVLVPVGSAAYERLRIEAGWPLCGPDYGSDNFPQETGLEDAVDYTKGCYLGQEVVARIHYRGGVNKSLRHVRPVDGGGADCDSADCDSAGDALLGKGLAADGRAAGTLTSVATTGISEEGEGWIGLAIVHQRAENDTQVEIEGGGMARLGAVPSS